MIERRGDAQSKVANGPNRPHQQRFILFPYCDSVGDSYILRLKLRRLYIPKRAASNIKFIQVFSWCSIMVFVCTNVSKFYISQYKRTL